MKDKVEIRNNYLWPSNDIACWKYLNKRLNTPKMVANHCKNKRTIIQAGGNAGLYVDSYSKMFETVYTFEPDLLNFYCLAHNTKKNVIKFQCCLGDYSPTYVSLGKNESNTKKPNTGGFYVKGIGKIPCLPLDFFNFDNVDCLHLDIEGYELPALKGAVKTIIKHLPIIALEINGLNDNYGYSSDDIFLFLDKLNYKKISYADDDIIFQHTI